VGAFGNTQNSTWNPFRTYKVTNSESTGAGVSGKVVDADMSGNVVDENFQCCTGHVTRHMIVVLKNT
jgi:hypothetical protein